MEPQSAAPNPSAEMGAYRAPEALTPDKRSEAAQPVFERLSNGPEAPELAPQASQAAPITALPQLPSLPAPQAAATTQVQPQDTNPLSASDEDLIEKEWVDKAKKIVNQTKDDPYAQEKEVSKLQADYLKKRYGKELKLSSD
jgi:hypothetical protein